MRQTIFNGSGSEKPLVPQGVGGGSTVVMGTARRTDGGRATFRHFPPRLKARQELMPTRGIRLFN